MTGNEYQTILVINDIEATRRGIKEMLERDGYRVLTVRDEPDAEEKRDCLQKFDLILISLEGEIEKVIAAAKRVRASAESSENVPIVIFCGDEATQNDSRIEPDVYLTCPDDFNQLRKLIGRLLAQPQTTILNKKL